MRSGRRLGRYIALAALLGCSSRAAPAQAYARGLAVDSCSGCHGSGASEPAQLSLTADPASFAPGDLVTFALSIRGPALKVGGAYVTSAGVGSLQPLSGEGMTQNGQGLSHSSPRAAANGAVTLRFTWRAPMAAGAVSIDIAAVAGNGNGASSGDTPGNASFQWVFGCEGRKFFFDSDRDGFGDQLRGTRLSCVDGATPTGYAAVDGDCDENDEKVHPSALEVCNKKDDDCDGQIDEGAPPVEMWPDVDGDGFYARQLGASQVGCGDVAGYAALGGDCDDLDPAVYPAAPEICNNRDDDCDGEADEQARPRCGVGLCARYSRSCDPADCAPGPPVAETCNAFDDDCDGVDDNDACGAGFVCSNRECVAVTEVVPPAAGDPMTAEPTPPQAPRNSARPASCAWHGGTLPPAAPWLQAALVALGCALRRRARRL